MHVNHINLKLDRVRQFCINEKVDEVYMRSLIRRDFLGGKNAMKTDRRQVNRKKVLQYIIFALILLIFQKMSVMAGKYVADLFSYEKLDPYNAYAWNFLHHITMLVIGLFAVLILRKPLKVGFGLGLGDRKTGTRFVVRYTAVLAGVSLIVHILMKISNSLPVYAFPLNTSNIVGTLCFQLFLTGPAEELLYRALPITILVRFFGENAKFKWGITLENIIAAFLFAVAHMKWSLFPLSIEANWFQLVYAFAQGIISGKAYQDSGSVFYPMMMHSISNVLMVGTGYLLLFL